MEKSESQRVALESLLLAISEIDGGCCACVRGFVRSANEGLYQAGLPWRFTYQEDYGEVGLASVKDSRSHAAIAAPADNMKVWPDDPDPRWAKGEL